ncbi:MAG: hypothetical protein QGG40_06735, partial [Myxococcota bacterium]|nr:hypothetical protein [Myxococcota bacterium]
LEDPLAPEPEAQRTSFANYVHGILNTYAHPIIIDTEVPCAQGSMSGDRGIGFTLELGSDSDSLRLLDSQGSCGNGVVDGNLCLYPNQPFDTPIPEVEEVIVWTPDGNSRSAGRTGGDSTKLHHST